MTRTVTKRKTTTTRKTRRRRKQWGLVLNSFLIEGSIFTPDVDGVAGSTLIFFVDGGSVLILGMAPPGAGRSSPLMICFNKFSVGPSAIPSGSLVPWYTGGPLLPVRMRFTSRSCWAAIGFIILTAMLSSMLLSFNMRCSAANRLALFNNALSVICNNSPVV